MLAPFQYNTLDHFIMWLEGKNPKETFNFWIAKTCALGQYDSAHGVEPHPHYKHRFDKLAHAVLVGPDYRGVNLCAISFGDVLKRARAVRGW